ncbi:MAG: SpoIIE family protein phosphatase [Salinivirgaceae bacterium]|nr:SpoIIE family protein phosphatase [Salinivirgaceae bacterium]
MKKNQIIYELIHSRKSFFSKEEKIKLIKTGSTLANAELAFENKLFEEKYYSLLKLLADIILLIDNKGNVIKSTVCEEYQQEYTIPTIESISNHVNEDSSCVFASKINQTLKNHRSYIINFTLHGDDTTNTFEAVMTPYNEQRCLIHAVDISKSQPKIQGTENTLRQELRELSKEKGLLELSNQKLISRNRDLIDSISYAKKIQRAIFPEPKAFQKIFIDSFILFTPKDMVSGDMYWFERYEDTTVLAVVDCTGHGVPGAFIAVLAYSLLNKILSEKNVQFKQPSELLSELHFELTNILNHDKSLTEVKDGMDISLCLINQGHNILYFSGAFHNLYRVTEGSLQIVKGDKLTVGGGNYGKKEMFRFTTKAIHYDSQDAFYLTSDGYLDQFGGEKDKKFLSKRFRNMIEENYQKPMVDQVKIFENQYNNWKGDNEQVDDILVVGFKCKF